MTTSGLCALRVASALAITTLLCGCQIGKFNKPPGWASVVAVHNRFYGINVAYEGIGIQLGFGSMSYTVLPVSTNTVHIPKFSDTMSLGQSANPFDTRIKEYIQSGWSGDVMPTPAMKMFENP